METLIIKPKTKEQTKILKAFLRAMKIDFTSEKLPYEPTFVKKILESRGDIKNSKGIKIDTKDLWK